MHIRVLDSFHPLVRRWFTETLGSPSPPQMVGWPAIASGSDTLILAPTGTGKTLAAFLWELNALIVDGLEAPLANAVHLLYISPLKALNNDVQKNLERPLAELKRLFEEESPSPDQLRPTAFPDIRVAVRTGDTSSAARAKMLRKTPHILITTPESLHILLTSVRGRTMFSALRAVIIDEVHAVAGTKRGAHLSLTLERLSKVAPAAPQRIALSATQKPLEEIARFLGGCETPATDTPAVFRPVSIVDCGLVKKMETRVVSPVPDLAHVDGTIWTKVAPLVLEQVRGARTTLVFVNNRGQSEKIAARLNALAEEEIAQPYHGSLSRERRLALEERLKAGELRALVTTSSLELGIDVGSVDLVVLLQSPKRVSAALQRIGRAGHSLDAVSTGMFVPTFRDDALEQLAILDAMREGDVEPTKVVQNALDVLSQLLVAIVASEPDWTADALFEFVRHSYAFHALTRAAFDETLAMLSGKYPSDVAAELDARITWDRTTGLLTPARSSRLVATISGGTIPDRGLYTVNLGDKTRLGELDEEFVHESRVGDVFQLGSSTWRIQSIEHDRVVVIPAPGAPARMPFWHGEFMARSYHLTPRVSALRAKLDAASTPEDLRAIEQHYHADESTVGSLVEYVHAQREITGIVPDDTHLVLEHFRDEVGSIRLVLHAPFGGRVNAPWGMVLARRMRERLGVEVQVQTTDDGLMLRLPDMGAVPPIELVRGLSADEAERLVLEEVGASSLFGARFRMNAARALLLPRGNTKRRMPLWLQRLKALDLLQAVQEYPSFPIVVETYRDVLQDAFDMTGLRDVLTGLASSRITIRTVETKIPSPFAQSLQFGFVIDWMYGDDTPRAEQRATLLSLDRVLLDELMGGEGADDSTLTMLQDLLGRRRGTMAGRQARDADELALLLDRAGDLSADELAERVAPPAEWLRGDPRVTLLESRRMISVLVPTANGAEERFIPTDAFARYVAAFGEEALASIRAGADLHPAAAAEVVPPVLLGAVLTPRAAQREILVRWIALAGPVSVEDIRNRYDFDARWIVRRLGDWEKKQILVRGVFGGDRATTRWCSRRLLEQARRRELAQARKQIQAASIPAFQRFMQRWQHLTPATRFAGDDATALAMSQMYGVARSIDGWDRDYLPVRAESYDVNGLSRLAASGSLVWAAEPVPDSAAKMTDARVKRVRFFERGAGRLWLGAPRDDSVLSDGAIAAMNVLRSHGALFTGDIGAAARLDSQATKEALRELVAAGLVTNDTVDALRDVVRWRPIPTIRHSGEEPDPTRWLPADYVRSEPVVQRRVNLRRLPKWRRPDRPDASMGTWGGRWSLVHTLGVMGEGAEPAEQIAHQWLARYGIVSRDWHKKERPNVEWRAIYHELKRLEYRGDVQRGYFIAGLAGAQFALPEAVELLRAPEDDIAEVVAMSASDPANVYTLPLSAGSEIEPLARPRGAGAVLVTLGGRIVLTAESRGSRVRIAPGTTMENVSRAAPALVQHLLRIRSSARQRDIVLITIDSHRAPDSRWAPAFEAAGFRRGGRTLRHYGRV